MIVKTRTLIFLGKLLIFLIILFQIPLEKSFNLLKYLDELLPFVLFIVLILNLFKHKGIIYFNRKEDKIIIIKIIYSIILLFSIGLIGSIKFKYQSINHVLPDIVLVFKGFLTYTLVGLIGYGKTDEKYYGLINMTIRAITLFMFSLLIFNYILKIYPTPEIRWGIPAQMLMFGHPTYLASFAVACLSILISLKSKFPKNNWFICMLIFITLSTLRSKAVMFIIILFFMYYLIIKLNQRLQISATLILFIIGLYFINDKIFEYLSNPEWARSALMLKSFQVANDHFPFGSGFSSFATWTSGVYYSPLYYTYGLSNIFGLTVDNYAFVGDTFWPAILGQFGYIGCAIVIYIIYQIYVKISLIQDKYIYLSKLSILVYLLVLSTGETSFMSPVGPLLCLIMAIED